jgi:hypothetical protein
MAHRQISGHRLECAGVARSRQHVLFSVTDSAPFLCSRSVVVVVQEAAEAFAADDALIPSCLTVDGENQHVAQALMIPFVVISADVRGVRGFADDLVVLVDGHPRRPQWHPSASPTANPTELEA